ncbi:MAG: ATP-binding cassette domain-containing protein [Ignavibacteria bacterium]|nr:ATP-binding cassette domain-containing protein [Ignavibacteria bacterium]
MNSLEFKNISKNFGNFAALKSVSLNIPENSVFCLLGENGAGKSTLMKILSGFLKPDEGEIFLNQKNLILNSTDDAIKSGIGMIYQHFMLIKDFTVFENVILGNELSKGIKLDNEKMMNTLYDLNLKYKLNLNLNSKAEDLNISEQQKTEILKLLYNNPEIIILDEPTAVLSPDEINSLFEIIKVFKSEGKTIILITHKLKEVIRICDFVAVLRKGELVFESGIKDLNIDKLASEITGEIIQDNSEIIIDEKIHSENILAEIKNLKIFSDSNLNLILRPFEITGIVGVEGNGQVELINFITGMENYEYGSKKFITDKVSLIPDDRINKGVIGEFSFPENLFLHSDFNTYKSEYLKDKSENLIQNFDIRIPDLDIPVKSLSGGNMQKVIIAREFDRNNDILIFHHPTRGVDIKSSELIYSKIFEEKLKGKSILIFSSDIDEILKLSDRILVLYKGNFLKSFTKSELSRFGNEELSKIIGKLMIGIDET